MAIPAQRLFTVDDYRHMEEAGIIAEDDRVELLEGIILQMSPMNAPHVLAIGRCDHLLHRQLTDDYLVSVQSAIVLDRFGAPQPDLAVIRQRLYADVPTIADVVLVIEVSDSSLAYDRGRKRWNYARAGIAEYWIVNLVDRLIERYTDADGDDYTEVVRALAGGSLASTVLPLTIAVDEVLPPGGN
ncbi:MAG: Uma2 family endonuclease [Thermomicrobiales bacterium]